MTTMREVAQLAGVSVGTVSRYLNNDLLIKPETAERIDKAIAETNYVRNYNAALIRTKKSSTIAIVIPSMQSLVFGEIAESINQVLYEEGFILTTYTTGDDQEKEKWAAEKMREHRVAGAIFVTEPIGNQNMSHLMELEMSGIKVLTINRYFESNRFISVNTDFRAGTSLAFQHILMKGYKKIGLMVGWPKQNQSQLHVDTFRELYNKHRKTFQESNIKYMHYQDSLVHTKTIELLQQGVDAIISISDRSAMEALAAIEASGRQIPEEVAVIGMGNTKYSKICKMTSLDIKLNELGRRAAEIILSAIRGEAYEHYVEVQPQLIIRKSSCYNKY